jgi:hypothetical protein
MKVQLARKLHEVHLAYFIAKPAFKWATKALELFVMLCPAPARLAVLQLKPATRPTLGRPQQRAMRS